MKSRSSGGWLVDGFLRAGVAASLYGEPGSGKTALSLDLALSVATGTPFMGREVVQGTVCYLSSADQDDLSSRSLAWSRQRGVTLPGESQFQRFHQPFMLDQPECAVEFADAIRGSEAKGADLIVVNPLSRNFSGIRRSRRDIGRFLDGIGSVQRELGSAVLVVHHSGAARKGRELASRSLCNGTDLSLLLSKVDGTQGAMLKCEKSADGTGVSPFSVEFDLVRVPEHDLYDDQWGQVEECSSLVSKLGRQVDILDPATSTHLSG